MSNVSLERYYFVLYDGALTLEMSKMALNAFCDKTLHIYNWNKTNVRLVCLLHKIEMIFNDSDRLSAFVVIVNL